MSQDTNQTVIIILVKKGKLLLERRSESSTLANQFLFPGGRIEEDEVDKVELALKRESFEELGITPTKFIPLSPFEGQESKLILVPFLITKWQGEVPDKILDKGNPVFWVDIEDVAKSPLESVQQLVKLAKDYIL